MISKSFGGYGIDFAGYICIVFSLYTPSILGIYNMYIG